MAWTTPKTWTSEPLTSSDLNTHLRDNLLALKQRGSGNVELDEASQFTTTSTSFVDIDGTVLTLDVTTTGGDVLVGFVGTLEHSANGGRTFFNISVDGVSEAADDGIFGTQLDTGARNTAVCFVYRLTGLSAGTYTIRPQWKVASGTATLYTGDGTSNEDMHGQFWAQEV